MAWDQLKGIDPARYQVLPLPSPSRSLFPFWIKNYDNLYRASFGRPRPTPSPLPGMLRETFVVTLSRFTRLHRRQFTYDWVTAAALARKAVKSITLVSPQRVYTATIRTLQKSEREAISRLCYVTSSRNASPRFSASCFHVGFDQSAVEPELIALNSD